MGQFAQTLFSYFKLLVVVRLLFCKFGLFIYGILGTKFTLSRFVDLFLYILTMSRRLFMISLCIVMIPRSL